MLVALPLAVIAARRARDAVRAFVRIGITAAVVLTAVALTALLRRTRSGDAGEAAADCAPLPA